MVSRILIADDKRDLVKMLSYNLEKKGHQTVIAHDGGEAWDKIKSERADLVILDLMMPGIDGWELCRLIRNHQNREIRDLGILMLTARALPEDRVDGLKLGADDYLTKPFALNELILRAEKILAKRIAFHGVSHELHQLQHKVKASEENLHQLVHDMKTPLISMGTMAKLLLNSQDREEKLRFLKNIYDSSLRITQWVDSVLKHYALSSQDLKPQIKEVEIPTLVRRVIGLMDEYASRKRIKICFEEAPGVPTIQGDESLIERAVANVLANALKYTPEGGQVDLSVIEYLDKGEPAIVEIAVEDTGTGISPEDLDRVFEPFHRGKNASGEDGAGLGLSLVKEVVELHGGKVLVQSEPQKGSTFSILLPVGEKRKGKEVERELTKT
jgi:two-component system sensor histidine kinase/response regulator